MSTPIVKGVSTNETGDETHMLNGHELGDVNSATSSLSSSVTSNEVVKQFKKSTDPLTKQLERRCGVMEELWEVHPKHYEWLNSRSIEASQQ